MEKPTVYVETSVISYLTARPSRVSLIAGRQQITCEMWRRREELRLVTSQIVFDEISRGNRTWSQKRLLAANELDQIEYNADEVDELAGRLVNGGSLPASAWDDALHVAVATLGGAEFLVTWNLKHLANGTIRRRIEKLTRVAGLKPVIIVTPAELLEELS